MTPILQALAAGYAAPQVLDFITRAFPSLSSRVKKAKSAGYGAEKILDIINRGMGSSENLTEMQIHQQRDEQQGQISKDLLKLGAGALATYGASKMLPTIAQPQLGQAVTPPPIPGRPPQPPGQGQGPIGPTPMANAPVAAPPIPQARPANPAIAAGAVPQQPQAPTQPQQAAQPVNSAQILQQMGLDGKINALRQAGNTPEGIHAGVELGLKPGQRKWLDDQIKAGVAKPLPEMIQEYVASQPAPQKAELVPPISAPQKPTPSIQHEPSLSAPVNEQDRIDQMTKEWEDIEKGYEAKKNYSGDEFWEKHIQKDTVNPPKSTKDKIRKVKSEITRLENRYKGVKGRPNIEQEVVETYEDIGQYLQKLQDQDAREQESRNLKKGALVATPDGIIGDIKDVKEKEALVEADGKLHKVNREDMEQPSEDLIEAAQNLLKIPEVDRSSVISLVTYRPKMNQLFVQYHNGETYVYEDIAKERVDEIANALGVPVTSGKNIYGAWDAGKQDSRGAALIHGVIRDPKYAKDQEGKTWEKLGTMYDYWQALRRKSKRKKK